MSDVQQVLVVEDETGLADLLRDYLAVDGYQPHIISHGLDVVDWVRENQPALILLDLMLPGKDGMEICKEVRQFSQVPVIMTTARVEEIDRLLGLELGADDYICKPYSPREVVARVKAVLRRAGFTPEQKQPEEQLIQLDEERFIAVVDGNSLELTPVEFRLMQAFLKHPGKVLSRAKLIQNLYTDGRVVSDRTVDTHVKNLRKKLQAVWSAKELSADELIHSVYGVGYKFSLDTA